MRKRFLGLFAAMLMVAGAMFPRMAFADKCKSEVSFFGLEPWYTALDCEDMDVGGQRRVEISQSNFQSDKIVGTIIAIVGIVVKDLMFIAGFIAVGFVMYGGFLMITSAGSPGNVEKAKKTITGSLIGLVIAILANAIATFVFNLTT